MKTITIDFETYERELREAKGKDVSFHTKNAYEMFADAINDLMRNGDATEMLGIHLNVGDLAQGTILRLVSKLGKKSEDAFHAALAEYLGASCEK